MFIALLLIDVPMIKLNINDKWKKIKYISILNIILIKLIKNT